jgi:CubicO group peptidase (beta-lactamase class C family)
LITRKTNHFSPLNEYVYYIQQKIVATAAAIFIIKDDQVVHEWYSGRHDESEESQPVNGKSQFNVASIRKTYLGLAVSLLIEQGQISSVDDEIGLYLEDYRELTAGISLRHLLTHTHGLVMYDGKLVREFEPGENWAYRNAGINLLVELVVRLSGTTLSRFLQKHVFEPYKLLETGWRTEFQEDLIYNYYNNEDNWVGPHDSDAGEQSNLFVSARDLAMWGNIHLNKGLENGEQLLPRTVFERAVTLTTPETVPSHLPRNGYIWWLQSDTPLNQLGEKLPEDSYQVLGITGCACLVIPEFNAVVVRMYNQLNENDDYDYLSDQRHYGNLANELIKTYMRRQDY